MSDIKVTISNADQISSAFRQYPTLIKKSLSDAVNKSLLTIGKEAAANAPVRTGNLRSSILDPTRGLNLASEGIFSGSVGSGVGYGGYVEFGTRYMSAQPYLTPAVNSTNDTVQGFFTKAVDDVLNKISKMT